MSQPSTIGGINLLPDEEKRRIYGDLVPDALLERFGIRPRSWMRRDNH